MMLVGFLLLLLFTGGRSSEAKCGGPVLQYLNLSQNHDELTAIPPGLQFGLDLEIEMKLYVEAILAVIEKTQTLISLISVNTVWQDERISWDPDKLCGVNGLNLPRKMLWRPNLFIREMTYKDESPPNPYLFVTQNGTVYDSYMMNVVSICKMDVYKFPFDIQSCTITIYNAKLSAQGYRARFVQPKQKTRWFSKSPVGLVQSEGNWELLNISLETELPSPYSGDKTDIKYIFIIKRRSLLYVINFLLPVLFFLFLDLASFLISDGGGEKLGFQITVLLAVTVLQLILNDILPSTSNRTPLIATYCIGTFSLMLLSLLETMVVMYLMDKEETDEDKDHRQREDWEGKQNQTHALDGDREKGRRTLCPCLCDVLCGDKPSDLLPMSEEASSSTQPSDSSGLLLVLEQQRELLKVLTQFLSSKKEERKPGYWTRLARRINNIFYISYILAVSAFLMYLYVEWIP